MNLMVSETDACNRCNLHPAKALFKANRVANQSVAAFLTWIVPGTPAFGDRFAPLMTDYGDQHRGKVWGRAKTAGTGRSRCEVGSKTAWASAVLDTHKEEV
jgi:hypothetical protein